MTNTKSRDAPPARATHTNPHPQTKERNDTTMKNPMSEVAMTSLEKHRIYIAYGSNMSFEQMGWRCPDAVLMGCGVIHEYELLFKGSKTGSYLTIEKNTGSMVPVAVWRISAEDEKNLDRYEGCPRFYYKTRIPVKVRNLLTGRLGPEVDGIIYIMHEERSMGIPTGEYYNTCLEGYRRFGFDPKLLLHGLSLSTGEKEGQELVNFWTSKSYGFRRRAFAWR